MASKKKGYLNKYLIPYQINKSGKSTEDRFLFGVKNTKSGFRLFRQTDKIRIPDKKIIVEGSYFFEEKAKFMFTISEVIEKLTEEEASKISLFVYSR